MQGRTDARRRTDTLIKVGLTLPLVATVPDGD
jgi:hypothetical protein